jgi:predicted metalloprotease
MSVVRNAFYCPAANYIVWDTSWFQGFFNAVGGGDMAVAAVYAHEWGHGTQTMLGLRGPKVAYSLYRELYADCMSGAWAGNMYATGHLDNIGVGDGTEALNVMAWIASPNVATRDHGTVTERQSFFRSGWTYGAQTCVNWLQS